MHQQQFRDAKYMEYLWLTCFFLLCSVAVQYAKLSNNLKSVLLLANPPLKEAFSFS